MAKTSTKLPSEKAQKSDTKSKSQGKKTQSNKPQFEENNDSDSVEPGHPREENLINRTSASNKKNCAENENNVSYKRYTCSSPAFAPIIDKVSLAKIIKDAFLPGSKFLDANTIINEFNVNSNGDCADDTNNISTTPKKEEEKPAQPPPSTTKIRAKRSYQSILSFFRRTGEKEESNNVISLQNIEASTSEAAPAHNIVKSEHQYDQFPDLKSGGISSSLCATGSNKNSTGSVVQNQIISMINKCEAEFVSLEKKIYLLETNYLSRASDSTGLTRGWNRCGILSSSNNTSFNTVTTKKQKLSSYRTKSGSSYGMPEILDSDRVFSMTNYATKFYSNVKDTEAVGE